jgi:Flp pilus assembly protein TadG
MGRNGYPGDLALVYLRAFLSVRVTALRSAWRENDRGASAVELAIISAVILVIAAIVLAAIKLFVTNESNQITNGGGGG